MGSMPFSIKILTHKSEQKSWRRGLPRGAGAGPGPRPAPRTHRIGHSLSSFLIPPHHAWGVAPAAQMPTPPRNEHVPGLRVLSPPIPLLLKEKTGAEFTGADPKAASQRS